MGTVERVYAAAWVLACRVDVELKELARDW